VGEAARVVSGTFDRRAKEKVCCPLLAQPRCFFVLEWQYYLTRQAINHANILVFNYQYMLDPKVSKMVSKELEAESIVVFDEGEFFQN